MRKFTRRRRAAVAGGVALIGLAVAASGCGVNLSTEVRHEERAYDVSAAVSTLQVTADSDPVEVVAADTEGIRVRERLSYAPDRRPTPQHTVEGGRLRLSFRCPSRIVVGFDTCGVAYRVEVPSYVKVEVTGDSGPIRISGVAGAVRVANDSGEVTVTDVASAVQVRTDSGAIRLRGVLGPHLVDVSSDSGDITGEQVQTSNLTARTGSGGVRLRLVDHVRNATVRADSGDVELMVPGGDKYAVTAVSDSGSKRIGVPQDTTSPQRINVTTDSGSITVSPA